MKFLFDITHPAVAHIYLPVIAELKKRGHEIKVVSRDKDLTTNILNEAGIENAVLSKGGSGPLHMFKELLKRELGLYKVAKQFKPDLISGTSANAARVALYTGSRSAIVNEDDAAIVPLFRWSAYPLSSAIITPKVLEFENYGPKHLTYPSFEKLFYLHPNRFKADPRVHEKLSANSPDGRYIIFRFSALKAHHDLLAKGLNSELIDELIEFFSPLTNIWLSSEREIPERWRKYTFPLTKLDMHNALAQADMLICDSQSMSVEAGVLGTKSFRLNSFVGKLSVLKELDKRNLTEGFLPGQEKQFADRVKRYYKQQDEEEKKLQADFSKLLEDVIDPLPWFIEVIEQLASRKSLSEIYKLDKQFQ